MLFMVSLGTEKFSFYFYYLLSSYYLYFTAGTVLIFYHSSFRSESAAGEHDGCAGPEFSSLQNPPAHIHRKTEGGECTVLLTLPALLCPDLPASGLQLPGQLPPESQLASLHIPALVRFT